MRGLVGESFLPRYLVALLAFAYRLYPRVVRLWVGGDGVPGFLAPCCENSVGCQVFVAYLHVVGGAHWSCCV